MDKEILVTDLRDSTEKLTEELSHFTPETFNVKPSAEEWSAAEVAEHLLKIEVFANKALRSETAPPDRAPDKMISFLKNRMEDNNKRKASEVTSPTGEEKNVALMITQFREQREELKRAVETFDLSEACTGTPHPVLGVMTRLEWLYFVIYHTERHLKQLARIEEEVSV